MSKGAIKTQFTFKILDVPKNDHLSKVALAFPYAVEFNSKDAEARYNLLYAAHFCLYILLQLPENKLYCQIIDSILTNDITTLPPELSSLSEVTQKLLVGKGKKPYQPNRYISKFISKTINKSKYIINFANSIIGSYEPLQSKKPLEALTAYSNLFCAPIFYCASVNGVREEIFIFPDHSMLSPPIRVFDASNGKGLAFALMHSFPEGTLKPEITQDIEHLRNYLPNNGVIDVNKVLGIEQVKKSLTSAQSELARSIEEGVNEMKIVKAVEKQIDNKCILSTLLDNISKLEKKYKIEVYKNSKKCQRKNQEACLCKDSEETCLCSTYQVGDKALCTACLEEGLMPTSKLDINEYYQIYALYSCAKGKNIFEDILK